MLGLELSNFFIGGATPPQEGATPFFLSIFLIFNFLGQKKYFFSIFFSATFFVLGLEISNFFYRGATLPQRGATPFFCQNYLIFNFFVQKKYFFQFFFSAPFFVLSLLISYFLSGVPLPCKGVPRPFL